MTIAAGLVLAAGWAGQVRGDFLVGTPMKVPNINGGVTTLGGSISSDGLSFYFSSERAGGYGGTFDIYVATRSSQQDAWDPPVNLGPTVNGSSWEYAANISPDGLTLLFSSDRPGGSGGMDMWMTTRPTLDSPWGTPVNLGPTVNSSAWDLSPKLSADGLTLLFHSARGGGLGNEDIWMATRATKNDPWGTPKNLGAPVNSSSNDGEPVLSADGLTLFFNSDRGGGSGNYDLWVTTRRTTADPWGPPANLGPTVNSSAVEWCGSLSAHGSMLYFTSDRPTTWGPCSVYQASIQPMVDFNGDGKVDGNEVRIMVENWGKDEPLCDIGPTAFGDGLVDTQDLLVLSQYIGKEVIDPAVISYWKLDEAEGITARNSAAGRDAVLVGSPVWRPGAGMVGGAVELDGADDFVLGGFDRDPAKAPWSVFLWVKGGQPGQVILSQRFGANWLVADGAEGTLMTDLKSAGRTSKALCSQAVITDGKWHRVGLIWDGTTRTLCVDGVAVGEDTQSNLKSAYGDLNIGCGTNLAPGSFWSGLVDDVRIYNRVIKP